MGFDIWWRRPQQRQRPVKWACCIPRFGKKLYTMIIFVRVHYAMAMWVGAIAAYFAALWVYAEGVVVKRLALLLRCRVIVTSRRRRGVIGRRGNAVMALVKIYWWSAIAKVASRKLLVSVKPRLGGLFNMWMHLGEILAERIKRGLSDNKTITFSYGAHRRGAALRHSQKRHFAKVGAPGQPRHNSARSIIKDFDLSINNKVDILANSAMFNNHLERAVWNWFNGESKSVYNRVR